MQVRRPAAPQFYSGDCVQSVEQFVAGFAPSAFPSRVSAAVVPHAGWRYSGAVAAKVFESIRRKNPPASFVILGAVHRPQDSKYAVYARGFWETPLGRIGVDEEIASAILAATREWTSDNPAAHEGEHAIEVQLPFIKHLFPEAKIVPISVNADSQAETFGRRVGEVLRNLPRPAVVIGSTDLTHYGDAYRFTPAGYGVRAYKWIQGNDARLLQLAQQMRAGSILPEVLQHHSACGPGTLAATVSAAKALGAGRGYLVDYKTSYDVVPEPEFRMAVGYAGILF